MFRWLFVAVVLSACGIAAVWMLVPHLSSASPPSSDSVAGAVKKNRPAAVQREEQVPGPRRSSSRATRMPGKPEVLVYPKSDSSGLNEPVLIPDGVLVIVDKQEVASEKEGVIKFIGTEVQMGENVPPEKQLPEAQFSFLVMLVNEKGAEGDKEYVQLPNDPHWYRRWNLKYQLDPEKIFLFRERKTVRKLQVGDWVKRGQLLALINPDKSSDDVSVKIAKLNAVDRQRQAASTTKTEYARRYRNYLDVNRQQPGTIPVDTLMETQLQRVKAESEERVKEAEIVEAQRTLNAAVTDLKMHEVRAAIDGVIKAIYKNHQGDAIKPYESILRIENPARLRVEARLELQEALKLKEGMTAIVEASRPEAPRLVLKGHLRQVNCVAVSKGKNPVIVSGSDDETLRGWNPVTGDKKWAVYNLNSAVRSVACSPPGSERNLACFGCFDGTVRLFDLDHPDQKPLEMTERHVGPVLSVAFSPDGKTIATCGDDRTIRLWNTESRELLQSLLKHSSAVTSVQFASPKRLVSAGKDKRLIVWDVEDLRRPHEAGPRFEGRSGDVLTLGVSPDGKTVLFDQGKEIRLLTMEDKQMVGSLRNLSEAAPFSTMALFSPDGKTILTNNHSAPEKSPLQLWRTPVTQMRGSELRQFVYNDTTTCGAFAPEDGSFVVTGTENHKVLVWNMPSKEEIDSRLEARVTLVEKYLDTQSRDVRVWAELESPEWLFPGMHATMVVLPPRK